MDATSFPWPVVGYGSGWSLVVLGVWMIFTGRLVPRSTHQEKVHEANEWRAESRIKDAQMAEKDKQLRHLAEVGKTVDAIMRSIHRNAQSGDRGSHDVAT